MFDLVGQVRDTPLAGHRIDQHFIAQPQRSDAFAVKWDGEWQTTYEPSLDLGIAYAVGRVLFYLLVLAHSRSYLARLLIRREREEHRLTSSPYCAPLLPPLAGKKKRRL